MWQQLINTALLGTDKIGFDEKSLPENLRIIVEQIPEHDKETRFLKTAALVAFYQEAGQMPKRFEGEFTSQYQEDTLTVASSKFMTILDDILILPYLFRDFLITIWLDKLIEKQQVCNVKTTVLLLNLSENLPKKIHLKIPNILSKKGLILWNFKTNSTIEVSRSEQEIWAEGKLSERRVFFANFRKENPEKALELVQNTWKEESINDKMAFIEVIKNTFQATDLAFLTNILPEFSYKAKERKIQREIRNMLTGILMGMPETAIYSHTTEALKSYFTYEKSKGVLGWIGKENKIFILPKQEDNFFNINNIEVEYGFDKSPDIAIFTTNQHYWLACFIEYLPFDFWINTFEKEIEAAVQYFLSETFIVKLSGRKTPIFLNSLIKNALQHKNIKLGKTLISIANIADQTPLLCLLSISEREQYLISTKQLNTPTALEACFGNWSGTWSADFSTKILKESYATIIEKNTFLTDRLALLMVQHLHPSSTNFLQNAKIYPLSATPYYITYWEKNFVDIIVCSFSIKQKCMDIL